MFDLGWCDATAKDSAPVIRRWVVRREARRVNVDADSGIINCIARARTVNIRRSMLTCGCREYLCVRARTQVVAGVAIARWRIIYGIVNRFCPQ